MKNYQKPQDISKRNIVSMLVTAVLAGFAAFPLVNALISNLGTGSTPTVSAATPTAETLGSCTAPATQSTGGGTVTTASIPGSTPLFNNTIVNNIYNNSTTPLVNVGLGDTTVDVNAPVDVSVLSGNNILNNATVTVPDLATVTNIANNALTGATELVDLASL